MNKTQKILAVLMILIMLGLTTPIFRLRDGTNAQLQGALIENRECLKRAMDTIATHIIVISELKSDVYVLRTDSKNLIEMSNALRDCLIEDRDKIVLLDRNIKYLYSLILELQKEIDQK